MSHADVTYIIFCRIDGLKEMPTDEAAASVKVLARVVETAVRSGEMRPTYQSSVHGCLVLVPRQVSPALEFATTLLQETAEQGVRLAIGLTCGRVAIIRDLVEHNIAGMEVNRAARLAHLPGGQGRVAVEEQAAEDALGASGDYKHAFEDIEEHTVKNTRLAYRWLKNEPAVLKPLAKPTSRDESKTVHIVVYDIAGFSTLDQDGLQEMVEKLRGAVQGALRAVGVEDPRTAKDRLWYAPAGDGGVIVFHVDRTAWTFAKELRKMAAARNVPLRVGITTGPVVVLGDLPVGKGIIEADALSALPATGDICVSARFWEKSLEPSDRAGWSAERDKGRLDALLLRPDQITTSSDASGAGNSPVAEQQARTASTSAGVPSGAVAASAARDAPRRAREMTCLVVVSEVERSAKYKLEHVVADAVEWLVAEGGLRFGLDRPVSATEATASSAAFAEITRKLCRAEVAIFDITNYEPAVMLLMGIRAVVRRGITILSMGGALSLDAIIDLPFNIKDANLVSHAGEYQGDRYRPPWLRIGQRIADGIEQMNSSEYLDLPAFDAVRNLPPTERKPIPADECVLALVSFGRRYVKRNWDQFLYQALHHKQELLRRRGNRKGRATYGIVRSVDIDSPRLVSHAIYGLIRRAALCVTDWTDWRPNVFFEVGVRLVQRDRDS